MYINGVQVGVSSDTYTTPLNLTEINLNDDTVYFGFQQDVSFNAVALWKTRIDNDTLEVLTGTGFTTYADMANYYNYTIQ